MIRRLLLFLLLLAAIAPAAQGQTFPKLTGRVVDDAGLLSPQQEQGLTDKLAGLERQSGRQLVVATLPSLQDYDIADYGYRLLRHWGIGSKERNDGALLIVAPNERKVRIEVGYGLEGILTDALSSQIIRNNVTPRFRAGDMAGGIEAGTDALITLLNLPPEEARARALAAEREQRASNSGGSPVMLIFWIAIAIFVIVPMLFGRRGGRRYGGGPVVIWGPGLGGGWGSGSGGGGWGGGGDWGGFSGGGGSGGGGGASGSW
ncbi:hypothetical protein L288_05835 [Sphingobium quisquiliarum P25]|uniref:TPM domain-containing protein n=1 Tax=Sphingobium quisquiliarum P25 TaxID=1329909 RepID=T0HBA5_9SPHN|nr:TPM domain-containing protein [Sphingobium quisquiliarum]EQB09408.1 hypothetical protein L288_05835 [Sphingobium quisquiliarum P25]